MSTNFVSQVTIDRVIAAMSEHGVELSDDPSGRVARCNLNGLHVLFVLLDTVLIVRADTHTDIAGDTPDATLYLSANQINASMISGRAIVVNKTKNLVIRTESEVLVAAGLSDKQLSRACKNAVDAVIQAQDAMKALSESMATQREADKA
ncbi:YbjN domain-containing protein [Corynebacterium mayonis]|uniref:YbjN domain-containing protein n=1 Tax=Corynebacterium mayonis TaxID=3062461 RepID=UPI003140C0AF